MSDRKKHIPVSCISGIPVTLAIILAVICATLGRYHHHDADGRVCVCAIEHISCDADRHQHGQSDAECDHHPDGAESCPSVESGAAIWHEAPRSSTELTNPYIFGSDCLAVCCTAPEIEYHSSYGYIAICRKDTPHLPSIAICDSPLRAPPEASRS